MQGGFDVIDMLHDFCDNTLFVCCHELVIGLHFYLHVNFNFCSNIILGAQMLQPQKKNVRSVATHVILFPYF